MKTDVGGKEKEDEEKEGGSADSTGRKWASNMRATSIKQDGSRRSQAARRTAPRRGGGKGHRVAYETA